MLRPGVLLALHRRGLLLSSFHPMSHLNGTSNITTWANNQFPTAGLPPAGHAALWAAAEDSEGSEEDHKPPILLHILSFFANFASFCSNILFFLLSQLMLRAICPGAGQDHSSDSILQNQLVEVDEQADRRVEQFHVTEELGFVDGQDALDGLQFDKQAVVHIDIQP